MSYIIIDLETSGLDACTDEIIEIGAVRLVEDGTPEAEFSTLVKPSQQVSAHITAITGISNAMLESAPCLKDVLPSLLSFCGESPCLVAHNANFDREFLRLWLPPWPWLDTLELSRIAFPMARRHSLAFLCQWLDIENTAAHRALADALATAVLFRKIQEALLAFPPVVWQNMLLLCAKVNSSLSFFMQELGKRILRQNFLLPQGEYLTLPQHLEFFHHEESRENWQYQLNVKEIGAWFSPDGALSQKLPGYESREQQQQMAEGVCRAFNDRKILVAEAATGTGKSLAYLLPAVLYAKGSHMPVAVSTHTINLQEQLWQKDIPLLKEMLDQDFQAALVKGRSNYLCLKKWREACALTDEKNLGFMLRLSVWLSQTNSGDSGELHFSLPDEREFQHLAAHGESCAAPWCKHKNNCYVTRVRRLAAKADIIVINHSLLLSNSLLGGGTVLPPLNFVVVDEAHHLEKVAEAQLTATLSLPALSRVLSSLERKDGLFSLIYQGFMDDKHRAIVKEAEDIKELFLELNQSSGEFFAISRQLLGKRGAVNGQWRLTDRRETPGWEGLENALSNVIFLLQKGKKRLVALHDLVEGFGQEWLELSWMGDLPFTAAGMGELATTGQAIIDGDLTEYAVWLAGGEREYCTWQVAPLSVRQVLAEALYEDKSALVFTSATLESKGNFDFFLRGTGIDLSSLSVETMQLAPAFDYSTQAKLFFPDDLPDFSRSTEVEAITAISHSLLLLVRAAQGRTLVLFTSHQQLKEVYAIIQPQLAAEGIRVLGQGLDGSRDTLLSRLQQEEKICLLGASSFWEGIDVAGEALSLVVVVRLPFWPVVEPYTAAKLEKFIKEGHDGFRDYSLPQAILRFKQGFGRLIRTKNDRGAFCVLDRRIWEKSYSRYFLRSLPQMEEEKGTSEEIAWLLHDWLDSL